MSRSRSGVGDGVGEVGGGEAAGLVGGVGVGGLACGAFLGLEGAELGEGAVELALGGEFVAAGELEFLGRAEGQAVLAAGEVELVEGFAGAGGVAELADLGAGEVVEILAGVVAGVGGGVGVGVFHEVLVEAYEGGLAVAVVAGEAQEAGEGFEVFVDVLLAGVEAAGVAGRGARRGPARGCRRGSGGAGGGW